MTNEHLNEFPTREEMRLKPNPCERCGFQPVVRDFQSANVGMLQIYCEQCGHGICYSVDENPVRIWNDRNPVKRHAITSTPILKGCTMMSTNDPYVTVCINSTQEYAKIIQQAESQRRKPSVVICIQHDPQTNEYKIIDINPAGFKIVSHDPLPGASVTDFFETIAVNTELETAFILRLKRCLYILPVWILGPLTDKVLGYNAGGGRHAVWNWISRYEAKPEMLSSIVCWAQSGANVNPLECVGGIVPRAEKSKPKALTRQQGGNHYETLAIDPISYCIANKIPFCEGSAIKYITRHKAKGGAVDLQKAIHFITRILKEEYGVEIKAEIVGGINAAVNTTPRQFNFCLSCCAANDPESAVCVKCGENKANGSCQGNSVAASAEIQKYAESVHKKYWQCKDPVAEINKEAFFRT